MDIDRYNLPGITRALVIETARAAGITVQEKNFSLTDVYAAEEVFVTGTFGGLTPVREVDGRTIGDGSGSIGPMTDRLIELYREAIELDVTQQQNNQGETA